MNKGFTAVECLLCLTLIAILTVITSGVIRPLAVKREISNQINEIVMDQYRAIVENERVENECTGFNRKGNARSRDTVYIDNIPVIVSLGTGRIYVLE